MVSAIKKYTCLLFYFIKFLYGISNWESRIKKVKRKAILLLDYIADVSCITNQLLLYANIVFKLLIKTKILPVNYVL